MSKFVHLHLHTEYSLLDGACKVKELINHCVQNNIHAVAVTDHGNMYASLYFAEECRKKKIQAIIGCEMYLTRDYLTRNASDEFDHLILLAKNKKGFKNLVKLNSIAFVDGFYYKPRVDYTLLKQYADGIICLSACLAGRISKLLLRDQYDAAKEFALQMQSIFKDDFYIELQDHGLLEQKRILPQLIQIAKECNIPVVATNDVHYIEKNDWEMQDVLMCIQMKKVLDDPTRMKFDNHEMYFKSYEEMAKIFDYIPEAIENTVKIAQKCAQEDCFDLNDKGEPIKDKTLIPQFVPEDGTHPDEYLRKITWEGLKKRYTTLDETIQSRAEFELNIIISMGFAEYYLIVMDFIRWAKEKDIPVGPGRGSGAASIVAYAIGITDIDPIEYDLFFERFLNPERVTMPDFDIDFCNERRGEVIEYVRHKYHPENVAQIVTFGTLAPKAAVKDVGRVYRVPYAEMDRVTKLMESGTSIAEQLGVAMIELKEQLVTADKEQKKILQQKIEEISKKQNKDFYQIYCEDERIKKTIDMAMRLEGMPRNTSMHAAGVVICRSPIADNIPLSRNGEDVTTQFDMKEVESIGMLKMDFLALTTLTDIKKACQYIKENTGKVIDWSEIGEGNKKAYELIADGDTDAVFQLEQNGMKQFMRELKPDCLEDIIAGVSLYRPGPMAYIPTYIQNKQNPENVQYITPMLESILKVTYGVIVYQEQVMQIFQDMAGFSLGQADLVRRAMGKKDRAELMAQKEKFIFGNKDKGGDIDGAVNRGVPVEVAEKIFKDMESFASYAFNKAHAACYAVLAYRTAYLKKYYTKEFLAAVLNNRIEKIEEIAKYIAYMKDKNIPILPPDINQSKIYFAALPKGIRFGLNALKGIGLGIAEKIIEEREQNGLYKNFADFLFRNAEILNKKVLESLILGGCFDSMKIHRAQLLAVYDAEHTRATKIKKQQISQQLNLFGDIIQEEVQAIDYPNIPELEQHTKLAKEKAVLGVYVSGHPMEKYLKRMQNLSFNCQKLFNYDEATDGTKIYHDIKDGQQVCMGGIIANFKKLNTKKGDTMAFITIEDLHGNIECIAFPKVFDKIKSILNIDTIVLLKGKLQLNEDKEPTILLEDLKEFDEESKIEDIQQEVENKNHKQKILWLDARKLDEEQFLKFEKIFEAYANGEEQIRIVRDIDGKMKVFALNNMQICNALYSEIQLYLSKSEIVEKE